MYFALALLGRTQIQRLLVLLILSSITSTVSRRSAVSQTVSATFRILRPGFLEPPSTSQDDRDAVIDAVLGRSPAVEEAIIEASAAPRGSDEPKLGSPAALTQKADRVIRTKRPAYSSRKN